MSLADPMVQVVFVDALFLLLAGGMAFWFRAWLQEQKAQLDRRMEALEHQQQELARVCERLGSACRSLERASGSALPATPWAPSGRASAGRGRVDSAAGVDRQWEEGVADRSRDAYRRAGELLDQGLSTADVARRVGLDVAEINVFKRMREGRR